jgi:hypothetical protein
VIIRWEIEQSEENDRRAAGNYVHVVEPSNPN